MCGISQKSRIIFFIFTRTSGHGQQLSSFLHNGDSDLSPLCNKFDEMSHCKETDTHTQANSSFLFLRMKYARLSLRQLTTKTESWGLKKLFAFVRFFIFI